MQQLRSQQPHWLKQAPVAKHNPKPATWLTLVERLFFKDMKK